MKYFMLVLFLFASNTKASTDLELVDAMRSIMRNSPAELVNELRSNRVSQARTRIVALYMTWEQLSPESSLFQRDLAQETCSDEYVFICRNVIDLSGEQIKALYTGLSLSVEDQLELAETILSNTFLE